MKKLILVGLVSSMILAGIAMAEQAGEQKKGSSMQDMMQQMMKGEKSGESGMGGMMGMMKMMDQCSAMMESAQADSERTKEGQEK